MKTHFTTLYQYNYWANQRLFEALAQTGNVPDELLRLASHIVEAQEIWLQRIVPVDNPINSVWDTLPLQELTRRAAINSDLWLQFIDSTNDNTDWNKPIIYTNTKGDAFSNPLQYIMTHVVNHASYHRGQINMRLRQMGFTPSTTDFIAYARLL